MTTERDTPMTPEFLQNSLEFLYANWTDLVLFAIITLCVVIYTLGRMRYHRTEAPAERWSAFKVPPKITPVAKKENPMPIDKHANQVPSHHDDAARYFDPTDDFFKHYDIVDGVARKRGTELPNVTPQRSSVLQPWVEGLSMMQQTVLLTAIRGPDGIDKYAAPKYLLRWYRRCIVLSAMDKAVLSNPHDGRGGSFTGPSYFGNADPEAWEKRMDEVVTDYVRMLDSVPHHFQLHFMHAAEILGYKHADYRIRRWWYSTYERLVNDMHLNPETEKQLDFRLGDNREQWLKASDVATVD